MKVLLAIIACALFLFTFKLFSVPPGIETDEGAIAHNAVLIAETLHDQNGRFLPVFILSSDQVDWKQPVLIYLSAIFFKIFGPSLLVFKSVNVVVSLTSLLLLWVILRNLFDKNMALVGLVVLITTPLVIISSRLGNEGIHPLFFSTLWLLSLILYRKTNNKFLLVLSALALGFGFYSYKGMRLILPPWILITLGFVYVHNFQKYKKFLVHAMLFIFTLAPFLLITPLLELKYAGAVFERTKFNLETYRHYTYYWLANLDPSLWFSVGDVGRIFSVELFGAFLLSTLPLFLIGIKKSVDRLSIFTFILICYLFTPVLFGMAGSLGYGHRLEAMIPMYVIITTLGIKTTFTKLKSWHSHGNKLFKMASVAVGSTLLLFVVFNFSDFFYYYFFRYPTLNSTREAFSNNHNQAYYELSQKAEKDNLTPYIQEGVYSSHGEGSKFFEVAYFDKPINQWQLGQDLPPNSILLTREQNLAGTINSGINVQPLHILIQAE